MENINKKNYAKLIKQWQGSGQSQAEFCKIHQLTYSVFLYWHRKYKQQSPVSDADFMPISIAPAHGTPSCELVLPDGRRLVFYQPMSISFLKLLLT